MTIAGVDACSAGWLCVRLLDGVIDGEIFESFKQLVAVLPSASVIAVDIPIGLPSSGERLCDRMARQQLGQPRAKSVFPAPIWAVTNEIDYTAACVTHRKVDGRALTKQAFAILPKICEVNELLIEQPQLRQRVREIHPELCFLMWNGEPMRRAKREPAGGEERERLIDREWPSARIRVSQSLGRLGWQRNDLNDAFAALWTATRIASHTAKVFGSQSVDERGLPMQMWA